MPKAIMIGGRGCGKTVLLTVLTQTYSVKNNSKFFLEAKNKEAAFFTQRNWDLLTSKKEWPPPTPPETLKALKWKFHNLQQHGVSIDFECADFAGELFQKVFGESNDASDEAKDLLKYISDSHAVIVLINLSAHLDAVSIEDRINADWAIKACIDQLNYQKKQYCLVFTQIYKYLNLFEQADPNNAEGPNPRRLLEKYFPQVAEVYPDIGIIPVSAVNETEILDRGDIDVVENPSGNFGSYNINKLMMWIDYSRKILSPPPLPKKENFF